MDIGQRIKQKREQLGFTQDELAIKTGYKSRSSINKIEMDGRGLPQSKILAFATALDTTPAFLMGWKEENSGLQSGEKAKAVKIPVLGYVAAGIPAEAVENIVDWEEIPSEMAATGDYFGLVIKGDSMEPRICRGDVVIVKKQDDVESGEVAIVVFNGSEGTCKKVVKHDTGISLISLNQTYEPKFYTWKEIEQIPILINGKVVELRGKF